MRHAHRMRGSREGETILFFGFGPIGGLGASPTSEGMVHRACRSAVLRNLWCVVGNGSSRLLEDDALRHHPGTGIAPQRNQQLTGERHDHGFPDGARAAGGAFAIPPDQRGVRLEQQEPPGQLDQTAANPRVAGLADSLLPTL